MGQVWVRISLGPSAPVPIFGLLRYRFPGVGLAGVFVLFV